MASFNKVILIGNIVNDLELKMTQSGVSVISFRIAVNRRFSKAGEQAQSDFIDIVAWRQTAEFISRYFSKGKPILICGSLQGRSWEDREGKKRYTLEVIAEEASFVERRGSGDAGGAPPPYGEAPASPYGTPQASAPKFEELASDDDLPF